MKHSIQSKLIWALTGVVTAALLLGGGIIIWQNVQQLQKDIYLDALSFGELTNDRIITSFEQFYETENFLQFRKDVNPLISKQSDIKKIEVIGKSGELLYDSELEVDVAYTGEPRKQDYSQTRARDIKPSLVFDNGSIVYAKKNEQNEWLSVDSEEHLISFPEGRVLDIIYPHKNARLDTVYTLSYDALLVRILQMAISVVGVVLLSIAVVSFFAMVLAGKLVKPIKILEQGVIKIGQGALGTQVKVDSDDEIGVLAGTFNQMSIKLKKDTEELLIKEAIEKELSIAREIQDNMLPKKSPDLKNLDLSGSLIPASSIGGDIFDYLSRPQGTYIFIADVTGHGVPAGMVANITHSTLYSFSQVYEKPLEIMTAMNTVIHAKSKRNMFATACLTRWDDGSKKLSFCNAGHEQIIHFDATAKKINLVGKGGMALGMIADLSKILKEQTIELRSGDVLMLYSDGFPEAWKTEKENLGMDRLSEIVLKVCKKGGDAKSVREAIIKEVTGFRNNYPQQDDMTMVVMKVR